MNSLDVEENGHTPQLAVEYAEKNQKMLVDYYNARTNGIACDYLEIIDNEE